MKVVHYTKEKDNLITPSFSYTDECFYVPEQQIVLFKHSAVIWYPPEYNVSNSPELLEEAKQVTKGKPQKKIYLKFSGINEFDYDDSKLKSIIEGKEDERKKGIEELIKHIEQAKHDRKR